MMYICGFHSAHGHCDLQYSQLYSAPFKIINLIDNLCTNTTCLHMMLTNWSPTRKTYIAPSGALYGSHHCPEDNVRVSDKSAANTPSKDTRFGQPPNQNHPPPEYCYPPSEAPFPGAPLFYHPALFKITPSWQASFAATKRYPSYGPSWQEYDFPKGGYGGRPMFPSQQFTG